MSADTDRLIAQARANRDLFDQSLMLALAAALEAAEADRDAWRIAAQTQTLPCDEAYARAEAAEAQLADLRVEANIFKDAARFHSRERQDAEEQRDTLAAENERLREVAEIAAANFEESARQFYAERERAEAAEAQRDTLAEAATDVIAAKDAYMGASETGWRSWDSPSCAPQQQRYTKAVKALEAALAGVAPPEEQP